MASSGTIYYYADNENPTFQARMVWSSTTNTSTFTTTINYSIQIQRINTTAKNSATYSGFVAFLENLQTDVSALNFGTGTISVGAAWTTLYSNSFTVPHSRSTGAAPALWFNSMFSGSHGTTFITDRYAVITLNKIATGAYITGADNFNDEGNPVIKYYNPYGAVNLRTYISISGGNADINYRSLEQYGTSYTYELTNEEREKLINAVVSGNSCSIRYYLESDVNDYTYTYYLTRTFTLTDFEPYIEPAAIDMNEDTYALTNDRNTFIKGYSRAACQTHAIAKKGATITNYKFVNGGQVEERDTDLASIDNVENDTFEFTVTDSRGNSSTETVVVNLVEYFKPTCSQEAEISLTGETSARVDITVQGEFFNSTFGEAEGAVLNDVDIQIRHKVGNGDFTEWVSVSSVFWETYKDGNTFRTSGGLGDLPYDEAITVQSRVLDKLEEAITTEYKVKLIPVFDWSEKDFKFNVPVHFTQGFSVGDNDTTMVDYVVEQGTEAMGTNGTWYWSKWASGKAECYGVRNYGNMAVSTSWGSGYQSSNFSQDFPRLFKGAPMALDISIYSADNGDAWIARRGAPTSSSTGDFIVMRLSAANLQQVHISFHAIGRWKD